MTISETDLVHLRRAVELAREALADGDGPFGSVLVVASGTVRFEDRNREAHAWVGLGRIVYVASAEQISGWRAAAGAAASAVAVLPIMAVAPGLPVEGPVDEFVPEVRALIEQTARST
ncbi:nucleoside deaminase [Agromyces sp. SYSU T0242]|uniref:nucleoside deaminase n=1 Tax=Agromyces litoreus TaxID=3158561 RepID=UPI003397D8E6